MPKLPVAVCHALEPAVSWVVAKLRGESATVVPALELGLRSNV